MLGKNTYGLLQALIAPDKPSETSYDEIAEALTKHLAPKKIVIAEMFRFHKREQKEGESLQKLAEHCDFGRGLADALRDRVVCGIRDEALQRRLLAKDNLTLAKTIELAETFERAGLDAAQLRGNAQQEPAQTLHRMPAKGRYTPCYRCGEEHNPQQCRFLDKIC